MAALVRHPREGKLQEAEELFNKSLQIDPNNAAVRLALADLFVKQNRLDEAQQILQNLVDKDPANSGLRFYLGEFSWRAAAARRRRTNTGSCLRPIRSATTPATGSTTFYC